MGCSGSKGRSEIEMKKPLEEHEIQIIEKMWAELRENAADSGLFIFQYFFDLYPEETQRFFFITDHKGNVMPNYLKSQRMREHAIKVMNGMDSVMCGVFENNPQLGQMLFDLGYGHYSKNIAKDDIIKLSNSILEVIKWLVSQDGSGKGKKVDAWRKLLHIVNEKFKEGFGQAETDFARQQTTSSIGPRNQKIEESETGWE